jgi:IclR family transcriptional regulator, pca regulon regulatory protein
VARRDSSPDFIEAIARGLDVIRAFHPRQPVMSLTAVATAAGLARPTARRILLTLEQLGYVRTADGGFELTPRVLDLGMSYVLSRGLWEVARPHMDKLVARTHESSSIAQLDGSDIVYVARVAVPKIIALAVTIGTRFPAMQTSLGKVLLAALPPGEAERVLVEPSRSGITPRWQPDAEERAAALREVRARGWALTDQELAPGIRSVAAPLRDGDGRTIAALNVTVHAAETPVEVLTGEYLPWLLQTAGAISADWAACQRVSQVTITRAAALSGRAAGPGLVGVGLDAAVSPVPAPAEEPARHFFRWPGASRPNRLDSRPGSAVSPPPPPRSVGQGSDRRTESLCYMGKLSSPSPLPGISDDLERG